jgi:hydroxyacylglutathione hydrolase
MSSVIHTFTSFTTSNSYIVKPFNDEKCFIVDLPPDLENVIEFINNKNLTVAGALITHGHYDHSLGLSSFEGKAYINLDDEFLARNPQDQIRSLLGSSFEVGEYTGDLFSISELPNEIIKVHKNPGHTKGSVSYEFPEEGLIFTGGFCI